MEFKGIKIKKKLVLTIFYPDGTETVDFESEEELEKYLHEEATRNFYKVHPKFTHAEVKTIYTQEEIWDED